MFSKSVLIALVPFAVAGPIAPRQGFGSGLGSGLGSGIPSFGLPSSGGGSTGGLPSIPSLGSGGSTGGLPSIPGLGSGGSSGGIPSIPGLGSGGSTGGLPSLGGGGSSFLPGGSTGGDTTGDTTGDTSGSASTSAPASQPTGSSETPRAEGGSSTSPFGSFLGSAGGSSGGFGGSTQNGLSGDCKDVTVIFARGTTEMGNVGTAAGPPFFQALAQQLGSDKLAVQGVEYAASVGGIMQMGDQAGSQKMASLVKEAYQKCPKTKVVMSGYSQGAMLVHNAAKSLPADTTGKIAAVVNFGDPFQRQAIQGVPSDRVKIICHAGDGVCAGTAAITPDHLTYSQDANTAAQFVVSKVK
ncbi:cutinase precursor [Fusarium pseudocircinatum]|uniref:Cutinase n=1 Tax=Fusarium pseudocircinatum TaxID=56676 RepID=A0A8H5PKL4_9HYPO|nr:cutinase precursor [Fusarium pseudocircinatum]